VRRRFERERDFWRREGGGKSISFWGVGKWVSLKSQLWVLSSSPELWKERVSERAMEVVLPRRSSKGWRLVITGILSLGNPS
jgi:hypothetical protein